MTKFEAIIFALSITPFPHEVWSPASSASSGIELTTPILEVARTNPSAIHHRLRYVEIIFLIEKLAQKNRACFCIFHV